MSFINHVCKSGTMALVFVLLLYPAVGADNRTKLKSSIRNTEWQIVNERVQLILAVELHNETDDTYIYYKPRVDDHGTVCFYTLDGNRMSRLTALVSPGYFFVDEKDIGRVKSKQKLQLQIRIPFEYRKDGDGFFLSRAVGGRETKLPLSSRVHVLQATNTGLSLALRKVNGRPIRFLKTLKASEKELKDQCTPKVVVRTPSPSQLTAWGITPVTEVPASAKDHTTGVLNEKSEKRERGHSQ